MAHDNFYAICENKCKVPLKDKTVRFRKQFTIELINAHSVGEISITPNELPNENDEVLLCIANLVDQGFYKGNDECFVKVEHYRFGPTFRVRLVNTSDYQLQNVKVNVVVI